MRNIACKRVKGFAHVKQSEIGPGGVHGPASQ
jgi:hypothetical protein